MKLTPIIAAAGIAAAALAPIATSAHAQRVVLAVGAPTGPGWYGYHDRAYASNWDGPRYYNDAGPHHGWYSYNNNYYQNCSYRWGAHHHRDWRCW